MSEIVTHIDNELNHPPSTSLDQEDKAMSDMNKIVNRIEDVLNRLPSTPSDLILPRVPNHLRSVMNKAYEPDIISIGPYHRGKDHLAAMEEHKFRYLKLLLQRRGESTISKCVQALSKLDKRAKNSYEERFLKERRPGDFLETMLVDGCFIVEVIRKGVAENVSTEDTIFGSKMTLYSLKHDLLLLENQLPFFILQELFDMTSLPNEESNLVNMIRRFFNIILPGPGYTRTEEHNLPKVPDRHLLGLIHDNWLPSPQGVNAYLENKRNNHPITIIPCSAEYTEQIPLPSQSALNNPQGANIAGMSSLSFPALLPYSKIQKESAVYTEQIHTEQIPLLSQSALNNPQGANIAGMSSLSFPVLLPYSKIQKESAVYTEQIPIKKQIESAVYTEQIPRLPIKDTEEIKGPIDNGFIEGKKASKEDDAEAHIRCATELHEAGIKFKSVEAEANECSIFDIKFASGVLEIPKLTIEDRTESLLRNLIAYEQFWKDDIYQVTDYARFMDCLINSNKDVELLCRSGIIVNWLGDDKVIASMFNRLLDNVILQERSIYSEIYKKVNKHCDRKWNLWKAKLRHDYFNSPWALISFLAAVFLLLLTVLQTVYSVLSYDHS